MFYGVAAANDDDGGNFYISSTKETDVTGTTGKYIAFDLFLKVDQDTTVYLSSNSKVTINGDTDLGLQNAARVAFVTEGSLTADKDPGDMRALALATGTADIWEPNYDTHTAKGVAAARDTYGVTTTTTNGAKIPYFGIKDIIPVNTVPMKQSTTANPNETYFDSVTTKWNTAAANSTNFEFGRLTAGVTKIRVYMWVEGQDVDCENSASGATINFDLQFTTNNG